jgi:hypothetical protein
VENLYHTRAWADARAAALLRDGNRCTVARLLGGPCHRTLDVHHLVPANECSDPYDLDNLVTTCRSHHVRLEAMRRYLLREREQHARRCPHYHRYDHARRECEARMNAAA